MPVTAPSPTTTPVAHPDRIASIDTFRGLTILTMIFVNDVAGVKNIPAWMKHVPSGVDGMTFVDVVFPAFLFIVGMSIPYAVQAREAKGEGIRQLSLHILLRTLALLVLGVFMVNAEGGNYNRAAMLLDIRPWSILLYLFAIMIWNRYPKTPEKQTLFKGLQITGIAGLVLLFFLYRGGEAGDQMMRPHWWGILGLIGWAYLYSCAVYLGSGRSLVVVTGMIAVFLAMYMGLRDPDMQLPALISWLRGQADNASHAAVTLSGTALSLIIFKRDSKAEYRSLLPRMLALGLLLAVAGYFLQPIYGIEKNAATPSWSLFSAAICVAVFTILYWLMDVKGKVRWAAFLRPAGAEPLLIYFLPFIFYALISWMGITVIGDYLGSGGLGVLRSIGFSLLMLWAVTGLIRLGIRLHV